MKCSVPVRLVILMATIRLSREMPQDPTSSTARSPPPIGETIKQLTKQLMANETSPSDVVFDVRTPPKVKQQLKKKQQQDGGVEDSHAGIAIPVDEDTVILEESTKKLNFYKIEKPTTANSGLSTWILLSGQTTNKPKGANNDTKSGASTEAPPRIVKPIFKKRSTTKLWTTVTEPTTKLTKIKASLLSGVQKNDGNATKKGSTTTTTTSGGGGKFPSKTTTVSKSSTTIHKSTTPAKPPVKSTTVVKSTTKIMSMVKPTTPATIDRKDPPTLELEAKEGELELSTNSTTPNKKNKRTNNKRKKNKNRRKRPEKSDTNKTPNKAPIKEKPISTQIYNYLSREVMPTVGVGLVGLMVTAGLASYFLYPFGAARRSYEIIDRKDKDNYYYHDHYSYGGVAEEELIGKVIAGMPQTTHKSYRQHTTRSPYTYNTKINRYVEQKYSTPDLSNHKMNPQGTVETVQLTPSVSYKSDDYTPQKNYQVDYYNDDTKGVVDQNQQFVVGSYVKEPTPEVTPVAVPEHGPRGLHYRRRRQIDDKENEIDGSIGGGVTTTTSTTLESVTTTPLPSTTTKTPTTDVTHEKFNSILTLMKDLFIFKLNLGLQVLQNATRSVSGFLNNVQRRLDQHHKNETHH